jgi:hypothetical protein
MTSRQGMIRTTIALGIALTLGAPLTASAQGGQGPGPAGAGPAPQGGGAPGGARGGGRGGGRGGQQQYTPAPGARDLRSVLHNWGWHLGMLRGEAEIDLIASLEYQGKGTMQVGGQPCNVTKYRSSINYHVSGERVQITGTRPNGQSCNTIEVLSGAYAWNEDVPGAELIKGKGTATPMAAATRERMIRLWAGPQGALKSALAGLQDPPLFSVRPGTQVPADVMMAGKTSVVWEANKPVVTFAIPGVPGATATATLDAKFMAEKVVVRDGANTTEFTYSDYRDWNNPLHPAEAFMAGRMIERRNGTVVRDITTTLTETGQMYVVMPVPASVKAAIAKPTLQPPAWVYPFPPSPAATPSAASQAPTPRLANGKPDMTGSWNVVAGPGNGGAAAYNPPFPANRRCGPTQTRCKVPNDNFTVDYAWISPSRYWMNLNGPVYKPEHWDKIQEMDMWTNKFDPIMTCQPMGIPRQGEPRRIFHTANDITLFYTYSDYGGGNREYRMIPTDGRQHDANQARQATYLGYSVGKWEGDTLVIDSISFVDSTWLGRGGLFHSGDMRIVEKFTRKGNELLHEMTIYDPESFIEPWVMPARTLTLGNGDALIAERAHCEVYETNDITNQMRH